MRWLVLSALWSIPGVIQAITLSLAYSIKGDTSMPLHVALAWRVPEWQVWALATPLIVWAARRFPLARAFGGTWGRSARWIHAPMHLAFAGAISIADITVHFYVARLLELEPYATAAFWSFMPLMLLKTAFFQVLVYTAVVTADSAIVYQRRYRELALAQSQLEARLVEAQLDALKHQLHPHFLFNTINAIQVLVRKGETQAASRMLGGLGDLLRRSLTSLSASQVSLEEELELLARYLDIQTTRFPDRLRVIVDVSPAARRAKVPTLLLQPLVENAIEHGIAPKVDGGRITVHARVDHGMLRIEVSDDGVGLGESPREGHGVGLSNVRKRLAQQYPGKHSFELVPARPGAIAIVEIPYEEDREVQEGT